MARPQPIAPVKLVVAMLWADVQALEAAEACLCRHWGEIDFRGADRLFDATDYYASERACTCDAGWQALPGWFRPSRSGKPNCGATR